MEYYKIQDGLPDNFEPRPFFKALLIIEQASDPNFQELMSNWLCENGCRYTMAWGESCSSWDDSVDHANLAQFNFGDIPEDQFVMTTWHDGDTLEEVLFFAKHTAQHPSVSLERLVVFHIGTTSMKNELERKLELV